MRVLLQSIGSRGDIEPFLAMGLLLKTAGAEVALQFPDQFRDQVEKLGLAFYGLDPAFLMLIQSQVGKSVMGGSGGILERSRNMIKLSRKSMKIQRNLLDQQLQALKDFAPHKVIYHPKCVLPLIWEMDNPGSTLMASPVPCILYPDKRWSTLTIRGNKDYGPILNQLSYRIVNLVRLLVFNRFTARFRKQFPEQKIGFRSLRRVMHKTPVIYTLSPTLYPPSEHWPDHVKVTGYFERPRDPGWQPDPELVKFLETHPDAILVTFGSMTNAEPEVKTQALLDCLNRLAIPAIINTSWGGLIRMGDPGSNLHYIDYAPYSWIFPRIKAVVHHGGAGTTHAACKYGKPSLIIPHIADQFFWNRRLNEMGLGPLGLFIKRLNAANLHPLLQDLYTNPRYYQRAKEVGDDLRQENGKSQLFELLQLPWVR